MFPALLTEDEFLDPELGANFLVLESLPSGATSAHRHNFFEILFLLNGKIDHIVNSRLTTLSGGYLLFIRPKDMHYYQSRPGERCRLASLAYPPRTIELLFAYLGEEFQPERLLQAAEPPCARLSASEKERAVEMLKRAIEAPALRKKTQRLELLRALLELLVLGFAPGRDNQADLPLWMRELMGEMQKPENYLTGFGRMAELADVSPEHMARSFRRFLNVTPTEFIGELRLKHAANLLAHTDGKIKNIASESGFASVSYFFHLFYHTFGQTPAEYRKIHQKNLITAR